MLRKAVAPCSTSSSISSLASPTSGVSQKLVGRLQQERLAVKQEKVNSQRDTQSHHPFFPLVPTASKVSGFSRRGLAGPRVSCGEQPAPSVCRRGPLLAAGSGLCFSITPILFFIRLCQWCVCSTFTQIGTVQIGGGVRR